MSPFYKHLRAKPELGCSLAFLMMLGLVRPVAANPTGLSVVSGTAKPTTSGSQLTVTTSQTAVLNWQSFNIGKGETTEFKQPSATAIVFNQINDQNASQIYGNLKANGMVVLMNSSGFYFGPNSFVSAAGLVISTSKVAPAENTGGAWEFNGPAPAASIINYGSINVGQGGSAYLIAENVENHGSITAPEGTIGLVGGQDVVLSERPDGRGLSVKVKVPAGTVDNAGFLQANGGNIDISAQAVNQGGVVQANSMREENGVIELVASDSLTLGAQSQITASGDDSAGGSAGGNISLQAGKTFSDTRGSQISAQGGSQGGNGGNISICAPTIGALKSTLTAAARPGFKAGTLSLDPDFIILDDSGNDSIGNNGTVRSGDNAGSTLDLNVQTAFNNFSQITLQAKYDITLADGTIWSLSDSTGQTTGNLTLEAGRNIIFGNTTGIYDANNWSVALYAGVTDFTAATPKVSPGAGSIFLNAYDPNNSGNTPFDPSGYIQTAQGSINLVAGQDVIVGSGSTGNPPAYTGSITTTAGGNISVHALAGEIDTGGTAQGYNFFTPSFGNYDISDGLGGISTGAGGDVTLIAGGNVRSVLPTSAGYYYDGNFFVANNGSDFLTAGSGAYGNQPGQTGNLTIIAGGDVTGHYLVANGVGKIYAGVTMDSQGNPMVDGSGNYLLGHTGSAGTQTANPDFALSLINGGWNVTAAQNIVLQEVRNPDGDFNLSAGATAHLFDYSANAYVNLTAGNEIQLGASSGILPRLSSQDSLNVPVIYPPILNLNAGAGGIVLAGDATYNQLILYPSPLGTLSINTTDGGSLNNDLPALSGTPQIFNLVVSDSDRDQYNSSSGGYFGFNDHAVTPVHLGSEKPVVFNVSGDMNDILLSVPEVAHINVTGTMYNCGYQGMNLSGSDVTSITAGSIANRGNLTSIVVDPSKGEAAPELSYLAQSLSSNPSATTLASSFYYTLDTDPKAPANTYLLTYQNIKGQTLQSVLNLLENLTIQVTKDGVPQWQDDLQTIPLTTTVSVINSATANALLAEYNKEGGVPNSPNGYNLGGGGKFLVKANNLDLGTTPGIISKGAGLYRVNGAYPLAQYFTHGADIDVDLTGNLTMYSSTISALNGGNIFINADGEIDVGSAQFSINSLGARGIFTTAGSDVEVTADKNIQLNGSRIAAYSQGSVTVISRNGNIDAGLGGEGSVDFDSFYVDPVTRAVVDNNHSIPGSGILTADTYFAPYNIAVVPGNILVETPNGSINAAAGGISQKLLQGNSLTLNTVALGEVFGDALNLNYGGASSIQNNINGVPPGVYLDAYAGYALQHLDARGNPILDAYGNPTITANNLLDGQLVKSTSTTPYDIVATGSGIVGAGSVSLNASGNIAGNVFALNNVNINALNNITVVVLGLGTVAVASGGGTIQGTIIGVGGVSASGGSIEANLESNNGVSGTTSGQTGFAAATVANGTSAGASSDTATKAATATTTTSADDDLKKKKGKPIALAQKLSRVTVILPAKN